MWLLLVLWLVAPLVELVVIVGLCVENDKKKRRLRELEEELKKYGRPELGQRTGAEAPSKKIAWDSHSNSWNNQTNEWHP